MAQLCVRVAVNGPLTAAGGSPLRTQPGDVVVVVEDGHIFSRAEKSCGQYRFIAVPGVAASTFDSLKSSLLAADGMSLLKIRQLRLDPAALSSGAWRTRTTATQAQIASITQMRP